LALIFVSGCSKAETTYYVDYAAGSDQAAGNTRTTAWKHAPGDRNATGRPAAAKLVAGDTVVFRAGVPYRGAITLPASGSPGKPVTYTGLGWGEGMGIIDGSDPVLNARPCRSAADCGGASAWKGLHRIEFAPPPQTKRIILYGSRQPYWLSQVPAFSDPIFADNLDEFVRTPVSALPELQKGRLRNPELAEIARSGGGQMELTIWVVPNLVLRRAVLGVEGDTVLFDPEGVDFYTDREGRVALNGSFAGMNKPGTFVQISDTVLLASLWPEDSANTLSIGNGRFGIELGGKSHNRITGLHFRYMTGGQGEIRQGRAITSFNTSPSDIEIRGNLISNNFVETTLGTVFIFGTTRLSFIANRIENIALGTGFAAGGGTSAHGTARDLVVEGNVIRRVGRSGIYLLGVHNGLVKGNVLAEIRGVHGNAITTYLDNRDVVIEENCVVSSIRPFTYTGNNDEKTVNDVTVRNNIFIASTDGPSAIYGWGMYINKLIIENNFLAGRDRGILLNGRDRNLVVRNNETTGITVNGTAHASWDVRDNVENLSFSSALGGTFTEEGCSVEGRRANFTVNRSPG
jgi:hypothetical protein